MATKKNTVTAPRITATRLGGASLFPNPTIQPMAPIQVAPIVVPRAPGYTGSGWNYGGQSYSPAPAGVSNALGAPSSPQAIGANPFASIISQARAWLQNPNQMRQAANQQVSAQMQAALGASNASSKAEQQQLAALASRSAGYSQALAGMGAPASEQVYNQYLGAANTIAGLGAGLTGQVASDQQAASDQATAAVAQQLGSSANVGGYDPAALRSAAYYTGTTLPATTLAQQAAQQGALTRGQYAASAGQVDQIRRDYEAQAIQALNQRAAERASLVAQRPALFQDALKANRDDQQALQAHLDSLTTNSINWKTNAEKTAYQKSLDDYRKHQDTVAQTYRAAQDKVAAGIREHQNTIADRNFAYQKTQDALTRKTNAAIRAGDVKAANDALAEKKTAALAKTKEEGRQFDVHQRYLDRLADISQMGITHRDTAGRLVGGYVFSKELNAVLPATAYLQYLATGDTNAAKKAIADAANKTKVIVAKAGNQTKVQTAGISATARVKAAAISGDASVTGAKIRSDAQETIARWNNATKRNSDRLRFNAAVIKAKGKNALGGLSAGQFTSLQDKALKELNTSFWGVPGGYRKSADGTKWEQDPSKPPVNQLTYNEALIKLGEMGPPTKAWEDYVTTIVQNQYPPGQYGRPLSTDQEWISTRMLQAAQKLGKHWGGIDFLKKATQVSGG